MAKPSIDMIVGKLPPPARLSRAGSDSADDYVAPPDDPEGPEREDYNAAEDSMAAFAETLKGDDTAKQLDAFMVLLRNADKDAPIGE